MLDVTDLLDLLFTLIFVSEMLIKIATLNFIWGAPNAYLRNPWNCLDFAVVRLPHSSCRFPICSFARIAWLLIWYIWYSVWGMHQVVASILSRVIAEDVSWVRALRVLRALRPLRVIKRVPELKQVVNSLFRCELSQDNLFWMCYVAFFMRAMHGNSLVAFWCSGGCSAIPIISNVLVLLAMFWMIFGILGVQVTLHPLSIPPPPSSPESWKTVK
eukprot:COSAG05_NODE_2827_length_2594_cov_36.512811_2_plen_215_part_00